MIMLSMLREIFDENAYRRFLEREKLTPSRVAYRLFTQQRALDSERRTRCC